MAKNQKTTIPGLCPLATTLTELGLGFLGLARSGGQGLVLAIG